MPLKRYASLGIGAVILTGALLLVLTLIYKLKPHHEQVAGAGGTSGKEGS
jgi:hypothetical protein